MKSKVIILLILAAFLFTADSLVWTQAAGEPGDAAASKSDLALRKGGEHAGQRDGRIEKKRDQLHQEPKTKKKDGKDGKGPEGTGAEAAVIAIAHQQSYLVPRATTYFERFFDCVIGNLLGSVSAKKLRKEQSTHQFFFELVNYDLQRV